ncbi:MAG: ribbon-helix-helix protein, CopG family [bacterium]|nr:ribbon-helix-helix protein, CopG family [bacterium]
MKTVSLKVPETLYGDLTALAEHKGVSRSALIRDTLEELFRRHSAPGRGSALALLEDLAGSIEGPEDLSFNKAHLKDLGS